VLLPVLEGMLLAVLVPALPPLHTIEADAHAGVHSEAGRQVPEALAGAEVGLTEQALSVNDVTVYSVPAGLHVQLADVLPVLVMTHAPLMCVMLDTVAPEHVESAKKVSVMLVDAVGTPHWNMKESRKAPAGELAQVI